ncbi:MAG: stage II sporulation protein P [Defluviitaleaceae bacterium]|nr:stage II sporulation protein P [Defluviitaleaceae bacterium]
MNKIVVIKSRAVLSAMLLCAAIILLPRSPVYVYQEETVFIKSGGPSKIAVLRKANTEVSPSLIPLSQNQILRLMDFNYLTSNIFLTDPGTILLESDIDVEEFINKDLTLDITTDGPQVLIFHAHSMEMFVDSDPADPMTGVFGVGAYLANILENEHGITVKHHMERFDMIEGRPHRPGSYERLEPVIKQILADNPSIQIVIDLHRDGVGPHVAPMVTYVNGKRTARIMFVNGLSRRYRRGEITPVQWLPNPYRRENLALSFNLQLAANQLYPGLARRIYLLEFRYSLHMTPLSILLEVGAQNNTFQEALNAMYPTANIIAAVMLGGE